MNLGEAGKNRLPGFPNLPRRRRFRRASWYPFFDLHLVQSPRLGPGSAPKGALRKRRAAL